MDTLSSLFSKKFKKEPALLKFHGINEDLYEGKKLISKRQRTKNKIAKKSPLLEGFANQLDDLTISEDQQTANLNADLQRNLSSYATSLKTVVSDYVAARAEQKSCEEKCNNLRPDKAVATAKPLIYGINTAEEIYTKDSQGSEGGWRMPSSGARLQNVSATGKTHIWGVNSGNAIYKCKRPCLGGAWEQVPGGLTQLSADDQYVYGVASDDTIWRMNEDGTGNWERLPGGLTNISASGKDWVWGVNRNGNVYRCAKPCSGSWIEDDGILKQAAADDNNVWGVKSNREIWKKPVNGSGTWERIPRGGLLWVSPSAPNYVWGVGSDRRMWYCEKPCTDGNWQTKGIFGDATQVEADNGKNAAATAAAAQANAAEETELNKEACLAGCKLSEAYLEPTDPTAVVHQEGETKTISSCAELGRDCNTVGHWDGCANSDQCAGPEIFCREGDRRCLTDADCTWANAIDGGNRDCTRIPRSGHCPNSTCADNPSGVVGVGIEADGTDPWVAGESSAWNVNNQKQICVSRGMCFNAWKLRYPGAPDGPWCFEPESSPPNQTVNAVAACQQSETTNTNALNQALGGRDLTQEYTNLDSTYLSDGQSNILMADSNSIDGRMDNIVRRRQQLNTTNNDERQTLVNTLNVYKGALKNLKKNEQGTTTLKAMTEDGYLKRNSASLKYYIWLGLAICTLIIAIRQLKK